MIDWDKVLETLVKMRDKIESSSIIYEKQGGDWFEFSEQVHALNMAIIFVDAARQKAVTVDAMDGC